MQRGYDVIFQDRTLGALLICAGLLFTTAVCVWGALFFQKKIKEDSEMRRKFRRENRPPK
ncbi:MAG: hypothetical protein WCK51_06990 [Armatimonadota bacterium]